MNVKEHGIPKNKYNPHSWILGKPEIGKGTWIGAFTLIDAKYASLKIGKGCDISTGAQILTHSTVKRCVSERKYNKADAKPVEIGDYVSVGTNAVILMGAKVGHHSIIAAGCVVPEGMKIPPYSLVTGVPGKIKKSVKKEINKLMK
ncbi:acetyltransferase [Candidatus Woesearchaeota archaeon]|nr:acetyltransferase [Candidatus Woesearchaeota archaeon]|tara:strand:+ start:63 stop:500 length:438 start_codon:yes stop_codon:yes gene_type:complete